MNEKCGGQGAQTLLTPKITAEHKIQHKEAIFVILESISQVDHKWVVDLGDVVRQLPGGQD
jgi:hypothetical protein